MSQSQVSPTILPNADLIWHMGKAELLQGLSEEKLEKVTILSKERLFARGETIFRQGDPADTLYIVNRGTVLLTVENAKGRRKILNILRNGEIFGEELLNDSPRHQVQAIAFEESWISTLPRDELLRLLRDNRDLSRNLVQVMLARLHEARIQIEDLSLMNTERRLAGILLRLAEHLGRPLRFQQEKVKLKVPIPHEQLAELAGANRPHISMILSKFKKKGWIAYQSQKLVIDTLSLRENVLSG